MKTIVLSMVICLTLVMTGGCATQPTAEQFANADYGSVMTDSEAQSKAESWLRSTLKDSDSAKIEWSGFERGWTNQGLVYGGGYIYGYRLDGRVNARNSFGGYTGFKSYFFMLRNGEVNAVWGEGNAGSRMRRLQ